MSITTDYIIVFMRDGDSWKLTPGSTETIKWSVLFSQGMYDALIADFTRRANSVDQDEIIVGCTHASYTLVKPR